MTSYNFNGQVAIVTGAGQGIGYEICKELALSGATVLLNDLDPQLAMSAASAISEEGGNCLPFPGDAGDVQFIRNLVDAAIDQFNKLDIVVANAGITFFGPFLEFEPESFNRVLQVNLGGAFFLAQAASAKMKMQAGGGTILLTSSVVGHQAHKNLAVYAMTKAGIEMLARNLVIELSRYKININCIAPGATLTERTLDDPDYERIWSDLTPMGRPATVQDIAQAALFLVSPAARHITGQSLVVDGGWTVISPGPPE